MTSLSYRSLSGLIAFGCAICVTPVAIAAIPPQHGTLLLVSLRGEPGAAMAKWATGEGLALVARGPISASYIVYGAASVARPLAAAHGAVVIRAPQAGCGFWA
ncbi:hypothetical protein [Sphingomonas japonica]|uniref:Uncharacterized protein n=1 Tax=Sphingomonas japonica TaxID=511662 RepID=A0ABX0TX32_9SPHN|nr:hypothetical protein [Sphingomonas japonica]NIJ22853.1 hypothetical protein [Sphingomonas japonica]